MSLSNRTFNELLNDLGDKTPAPGGGAVAPMVAALAAALGRMVLAYSIDKDALKEHREHNQQVMQRIEQLQEQATHCADDDATAYAALNALMKLDADDPRRQRGWADAVSGAMAPPRNAIDLCANLVELLEQLNGTTNRWLGSDLAVAAILTAAAARAAAWNVRVNLTQMAQGPARDELQADVESQIASIDQRARSLEAALGAS